VLSFYDLVDLNPAKLHMTVPDQFPAQQRDPWRSVLHYADLPESDVRTVQGFKITRPLRAILDLIEAGTVERNFIRQAITQAVDRGLITRPDIRSRQMSETSPQDFRRSAAASGIMPAPRTYATAEAFRRAVEERLKRAALIDRVDLIRLRRQVSFDRLLARLFREEAAPWVLKGGYALELRFKAARATVDIDLTVRNVPGVNADQNEFCERCCRPQPVVPFGDWFEFVVGPPVMDLTAAPYGGARFPVEARMDDRIFARFHLDAGVGDVIVEPLENDRLPRLAGVRRHRIVASEDDRSRQTVRREDSCYTLPRNRANSRVKDLVDLALLIGSGWLDKQRILEALS